MLEPFDWLRRSHSGAEMLATLTLCQEKPELLTDQQLGPPHSALHGPCRRCWFYSRQEKNGRLLYYCPACQAIRNQAQRLAYQSRQAVVIWGYVSELPRRLPMAPVSGRIFGAFVLDERHFLIVLHRRELKLWLEELIIYQGDSLKGVLQIFPTVGGAWGHNMGEILCRAAHQESYLSLGRLQVRFYAAPNYLLRPHVLEKEGLLTFDVADFLSLLEMATVFRTVLRPEEQTALYKLLEFEEPNAIQLYWGRLFGLLNQEARDMLASWRVRQWPRNRIELFYELTTYAGFYEAH